MIAMLAIPMSQMIIWKAEEMKPITIKIVFGMEKLPC